MAIDFIADEEESTGRIDFIPDDAEQRPPAPEWPLQEDTAPMVPPSSTQTAPIPMLQENRFPPIPGTQIVEPNRAVPFQYTYRTSPEERQQVFKQQAFAPPVPFPRLPATAEKPAGAIESMVSAVTFPGAAVSQMALGEQPTAEIQRSIINQAISLPEFFTTPTGILTSGLAGIGKGAQALASGFFTVDLLKNAIGQSKELVANWPNMTPADRARSITEILGAAGLSGLLAAHTAKTVRELPIRQTIDKAAAILPLSAEAAREIPQPPEFPPLATEAEVRAATQKGLSDAEAVRSYQGQPAEAGQTIEGGEANRRSNVEQAAPVQPEPVVAREEVQAPNAPEGQPGVLLSQPHIPVDKVVESGKVLTTKMTKSEKYVSKLLERDGRVNVTNGSREDAAAQKMGLTGNQAVDSSGNIVPGMTTYTKPQTKITVYHGSASIAKSGKFESLTLDISPSGQKRTGTDTIDTMGTWWTTSPEDAAKFGEHFAEGGGTAKGAVLTGDISLTNPKVFASEAEAKGYFNSFRKTDESGKSAAPKGSEIRSDLERQGYDGIIIKGGEKGFDKGDFYLSFGNKSVSVKNVEMPKPTLQPEVTPTVEPPVSESTIYIPNHIRSAYKKYLEKKDEIDLWFSSNPPPDSGPRAGTVASPMTGQTFEAAKIRWKNRKEWDVAAAAKQKELEDAFSFYNDKFNNLSSKRKKEIVSELKRTESIKQPTPPPGTPPTEATPAAEPSVKTPVEPAAQGEQGKPQVPISQAKPSAEVSQAKRKVTWQEQDSGLWTVYDENGAELGAIYDKGAKVSGTKNEGYDILDGWFGIEPGDKLGEAKTFQQAVAKLKQFRQVTDKIYEAATGEKLPSIKEDNFFDPRFPYGKGVVSGDQIWSVASTGIDTTGKRFVRLRRGKDLKWIGVEELQAEQGAVAKPEAPKAQAEVGGGAAKPFEVDEQLVMHSPHTGEDTLVSFRGLMPNGQAVVWTGKSQFPVPKEWLRRQGEQAKEVTKPIESPAKPITVEHPKLTGISKDQLIDIYRKEVPLAGTTLKSALLKRSAKSLRQDIEQARIDRVRQEQELSLARQIETDIKAVADEAGHSWRNALKKYATDRGWSFNPPPETTKGEYVAMLALQQAKQQLRQQPTPTPAPEAAKPWYESAGDAAKERIFSVMRRIQERVDAAAEKEKFLRPKQGEIAAGATGFDEFIRSEAQAQVLRAIRKGKTPQEASTEAKAWAREAIDIHNKKRPKDLEWQRHEGHVDTIIDRAIEELTDAAKPAEQGPEMVGMGGARPGEVPQAPQIVQLTEELKRVDAKPVPFKEKVKEWFNLAEHRSIATDAASRAVEGMKTVRDFMINKWDGVKDWDDVKRIKGELSAEINTRGWSLRKFENEFRRAVPRLRDREALSSWLDAGGDPARLQQGLAETTPRYRRSYEDALNLSPEMKGVAEHIRSYFESRLQEAIDAGVIEEGISDYIHRIYKRDTPIKQNILNRVQSGELNTRTPGLAMRRAFEYDFEAEKAGYPIEKDALKRIVDYEHSLAKVIASRKAVKQFMDIKMPDGRPMIDVAGLGVPLENAEGITEAMLIKPQFKRGDVNEPGAKTYRKDYKERNDYPAFRKWKWVATDPATGRDIFVQGDVLVHPDAAARIDALLASSALRRSKVLSAALDVSSGFKQTMLDFSGFHQVQIGVHALEHRVNPFNPIKDIDLADPNVQGLLKGGLNIGGDFGGFNYREGLVGRSLSRLIPGLGDLMQSYHEYLFRDYIPRIKTTMALHALERNRARFPNMNEEQINYLTAKQANAAFGGLNYMLMERSKTAQDISRLIMLAPDFLEARGQFAAQALQRVGKGDRGGLFKGNEQRQALLLGALTLYVTARIFNKIIDGQYHFEPENAFSIVNKGHSYSLRTVQGDLLHLWDKPFQFWLNRLNPVFGRSFLELGTGRDYFGRKRSRMELAWDLLANIRPIAFRNSQERKLWESVLNAMGVQAKRWSDIDDAFTLAQDWKKANGIEERGEFIYDSEKDPLRSLKLALNHGDEANATGEIRKLLDSGYNRKKLNDYFKRYASMPFTGSKKNDIAFIGTLNADQKETVNRAREHKRTIRDLYFKSLGQYDAAVASGPR